MIEKIRAFLLRNFLFIVIGDVFLVLFGAVIPLLAAMSGIITFTIACIICVCCLMIEVVFVTIAGKIRDKIRGQI